MNIIEKKLKVSELIEGYEDRGEGGVVGLHGILNIRPAYQREFVYNETQQKAVINTVLKGFPLNTMYFATNINGGYEVLDGQQRILSICKFADMDYAYEFTDGTVRYFNTLLSEQKERFLNYEVSVYICEGTSEERLDWFRVINTYGEKLNDQEIRNANYTGAWLTDAKRYFSCSNCEAAQYGEGYFKTSESPIRQDLFEKVLSWISGDSRKKNIDTYMAEHQNDEDASELIYYFEDVIDWANKIFPNGLDKTKRGLPWGIYYNDYHNKVTKPFDIEEIDELLGDPDVTRKSGVYLYLLSGDSSNLSIRQFDDRTRMEVWKRQGKKCLCGKTTSWNNLEAHHIQAWDDGGHTTADNCVMVCKDCHKKIHKGTITIEELLKG